MGATVMVNRYALILLRISIGIIYIWFGALKFFEGYSPAEDLAVNTINKLTFGLISRPVNIILLAVWEVVLGVLLVAGLRMRTALVFLFVHMLCTFTPLVFFPTLSFRYIPYGFTLAGQYIMKNIIIICAGLLLWPEKRGKVSS
jgi:uncharacterized membrane protein YphA (DoxX/SURF4 family)